MLWFIGGVFTFLKKCCVVLVLVDQDLLKMSHICLDLAKFHVVHHWWKYTTKPDQFTYDLIVHKQVFKLGIPYPYEN